MGFVKAFSIKNQWINMSLYFINFMYKTKNNPSKNRVCSWITNPNRLKDNDNPIGGTVKNNKWLANGNTIKTDFIEIDKTDLINFYSRPELGFRINKNELNGNTYKRFSNTDSSDTNNITNQEREFDDINSTKYNNDNTYYFLKGTNSNNILQYLFDSNII